MSHGIMLTSPKGASVLMKKQPVCGDEMAAGAVTTIMGSTSPLSGKPRTLGSPKGTLLFGSHLDAVDFGTRSASTGSTHSSTASRTGSAPGTPGGRR